MADMYLINRDGDRFLFAVSLDTVEEARDIWQAVAGQSARLHLDGFEVVTLEKQILYRGDYCTDEC